MARLIVKGTKKVLANLTKQANEFGDKEANRIAIKTYELSQKYCPVDTEELRKSGRLVKTKNGYRVEYNKGYALYAHEAYESSIKKEKNPNARSQFLKRALYEAMADVQLEGLSLDGME